jgi:hypothetical protein
MPENIVYTYCERCKAYIAIELPANIVQKQAVYPFPYSYVHGNPAHVLTIYLDQDLVERGHEISDISPGSQVDASQSPATPPSRSTPAAGEASQQPGVTPSARAVASKRIVPVVIANLDRKRLSVTEFRLLSLCDGKATLQEIAEQMGLQYFIAMRMMLELQKQGLVDFKKRM